MRIYIYLAVVLTLPVYVHAQTISMDKTPYPEQYMGGTIGLVGTIGGEFQVSPSGAAQYDVTFDLPEGAGGFSPEIGIAYDSRRGDGVLGHGFYLKGLSMITRTGSDLYHDGSVSGVSMTDADHFALDGMRLLYKGDNLYVPELNNLWRIKTDKSGNPNYFTIENGEGITMYYGSTMNGRISGSGEGSYLSWLLNKVEDANGNYYTIEYKNALGEFYVDNIKYGGNVAAGVSPAYTLKFTYSPREKCAVFYVLGNHYHTSHLLTSVEVFFGENFLRSYDFTYKTNVGKTLPYLKSIKLRGTDNIGFKSTSFEWSETPDATLLPGIEQPVFTGDNIGLYIGDFDGDGLRDYLEVANNANNKTQKIWRLFKNKGNGKFEYTNWGFLNNEHTRLLIGDFNADGKYDFIEEYKPGTTYSYIQYTSDGNNFTKKYPVITTEQRETIPIVADLNGDCMDDLILCYKNSSDYKIMFCHLTGSYRTVNGKVTNNWDNVVTADFSGDGMCDIINIHKDGFDYFRSAGSSQLEKVGTYWFFKSSDYVYPGDFNGDGNTDILKIDSSRKNITIYTSTGTGFSSNLPTNFVNPADYEVFIADINGDGMDDLYAVKRSGEYAATKAFINENYGTSFAMYQGPKSPPVSDCQYLFTADFTGNGKADIFFSGRTSTSTINRKFTTIYLQPDGHLPLLSKVTDEYGNYHSITYTNMYDAAVHEVTTDFSFPLRASRLPVSIVHEVLRNNGIGGENRESYSYKNGSYHCAGRGFLGFENMTCHDHTKDIRTIYTFETDKTYFLSTLKSKETHLKNKKTEVYTSINEVARISGQTLRFRATGSSTHIYDYTTQDLCKKIDESFKHDTYGNVIRHTQVTNGRDSLEKQTAYFNDEESWIIGRVTSYSQQNFSDGEAGTMLFENYQYTGANITSKVTKRNGKTWLTESYTYAPTGNVLSHTRTADGEKRIEYVSYDNKFLHKTLYTDAEGYSTEYTYDNATGLLTSQNGADGIIKKYEYDKTGRQYYWEAPYDGCVSVLRWNLSMKNAPQHTRYFSYEQRWGKSPEIVFFDKLGRKLREVKKVFGGREVYTDRQYNDRGEQIKLSKPYFSDTTPVYATFEYDDCGRLIRENYPDGTNRQFSYESMDMDGEKIVETNRLGQKTTRYNDFRGRTYKTVDNLGGIVEYTFDADGNCTSVAGPRTSVTMEYDDAGRRTRMTDSDCGTYRFEYNGFGEQTFQLHETSYMGVITEYDAVGRVVRREDSDGITDYIYETGRRRAVKEIRNDDTGIVKRFNYDSYNRLTDETSTIDGATLHTGYSYDSKNRLTYITYPNNFGISYTYDDGGNLTCATQKGNAEAWKLLSVDETGRPLSYRLGNGIIVKRTLDPVTGVLTSMSDSTLFHWEYHFNAEGNLSSRTDGRNGLLELFAYDGLNRLTSFHHLMNLKPLSNETIEDIYTRFTYDAAGNITSHSKIGKYGYADNSNRLSTVRMPNIFVKPMLQKWDVIEYNSHRKVTRVVSGERELRLRYGVDGERVQAHEKGEDCDRSIIYVNKFHQIARNGNETCRHSYIYAGNMLIAVCPDADTSRTRFYHKDHLGSVVGISDAGGTLLEEFSYDPWGRRRSPASYKYIDEIDRPADRHGFTGHEHIDLLSMVNMNGRLYDPYLGRFLSPDPFVQAPYNTQSLNRYAYCINNPLKYTDDTGHFFIIDDWIIGAIKGIFSGDNIIKSANRHATNAAKIIAGLFVTDPNKGFFGRALELFSRFTFQATQTMVGYMYSNIANMAGRVYNVSHAYGATAVANSWNSKSAVTLGSFILGREDLRADAGHPTFQHEYGHYLQSQRLGPAYWPAVALPSVFNVMYGSDHSYRSYEMNANYLAFRYFNEQIDGFYKTNHEYSTDHLKPDYYGWHFDKNPLLPGGKYVDYEIDEQKERMREATSIKVNFWNYFLPFIPNIR